MELGHRVVTGRTLSDDRGKKKKKSVPIVSSKVTVKPFTQPGGQKEAEAPPHHQMPTCQAEVAAI